MILGETYTDRVTIRDVDGVPASAGSVTAAVALPDGTSAAASVNEDEQGQYDIDYVSAQVGRHEVLVTATGGVLGTVVRKLVRVFHVDAATSSWLVSLNDAKAYLNIDEDVTDEDAELQTTIASASRRVESATQLWHRETVTEVLPASSALILSSTPARSVTSVTQAGSVTDASAYELVLGTVVKPIRGGCLWPAGIGQVTVVYEAGETRVPSDVREATLATVKHLWRAQRGASRLPTAGVEDEDDAAPLPYGLPDEALELLQPYLKLSGLA